MVGGQCGCGGRPTPVSVHRQEQNSLWLETGGRRSSLDEILLGFKTCPVVICVHKEIAIVVFSSTFYFSSTAIIMKTFKQHLYSHGKVQ